jgi:hypothetical protein
MQALNRHAMVIPAARLVEALQERIERRRAVLDERDRTLGADRIRIHSYMENIGWPELFGYDMNRFLSDAEFGLEMELRQRIFWLDNSLDDDQPGTWLAATVGMYFDIGLFGQEVRHTEIGVPLFTPHPIAERPDLSLIPPVDFRTSGQMPVLIRRYETLKQIAETRYGGRLTVGFPSFNRGPLDIYVQLRGYDRFVEDTRDRPQFVHDFLALIADERIKWNRERRHYLGESEPAEPTTRIDDDWVNIPFINPAMFREFVLPAYRRIAAAEGKVVGFHTCGVMVPVVEDLLGAFPGIRTLDISGWNDFEKLDEMLDPDIGFWLGFKNTFVLTGTRDRQRDVLERIARVGRRRSVGVCAQAIVRLHPTYEENLGRMNAFISLAREVFAQPAGVR